MGWNEFLARNGLGERYLTASLESCQSLALEILEMGKEWVKRPSSMVLTGEAGRGKTWFSCALLKAAIRVYGEFECRFLRMSDFDDRCLELGREFGTAAPYIQSINDHRILFIDDFGTERSTDRIEKEFLQLLDYRYRHMLPTIISTNLTPEIIAKQYGTAIFSRLKDYKWIAFRGSDLRGNN
jgi:DNA replication protein DnaC